MNNRVYKTYCDFPLPHLKSTRCISSMAYVRSERTNAYVIKIHCIQAHTTKGETRAPQARGTMEALCRVCSEVESGTIRFPVWFELPHLNSESALENEDNVLIAFTSNSKKVYCSEENVSKIQTTFLYPSTQSVWQRSVRSRPQPLCETEGNYGLADETNDRRARKWAEPCAIINFLAPLPSKWMNRQGNNVMKYLMLHLYLSLLLW